MRHVTVISHPLVQHKLTRLRDRRAGPEEFRRALGEIAALMIGEVTRGFATRCVRVTTPLARAEGTRLRREVILVPILRAGLGMLQPVLQLVPNARVGFIGLKRHHKSLKASVYHKSLPANLRPFEIILIDPMLATGGSAVAALKLLAARGARRIRVLCLVAAPEGIRRVRRHCADLPIFTAAVDHGLNRRGFIVPGLGDAGDRLFGV